MDGRQRVDVETGLDERAGGRLVDGKVVPRTRHARTRIIAVPEPERPREPAPGHAWEPLTVRARLHRMADVFRKLPHTPDTRPGGYRSCMPEPVREIFKDQPGEPMRLPVPPDDYRAAMILLDIIVSLTDEQRIVLWGIASKRSDRRVGRELRCHHRTAGARKEELLAYLVQRFNGLDDRPDDRDVARARELIRRRMDE